MRMTELEDRASRALEVTVHVATCGSDLNAVELNAAEIEQLEKFETEARRCDWRRGRLALKSILRSLGRSDDTSGIRWPMPQISLTHGCGTAIAVGTPEPDACIGIDVEVPRTVNERMALWFLNQPELNWLEGCAAADRSAGLIRLWTIKEAVFKSHPANAGLVMTDFTINDPSSAVTDVDAADGRRFRCASSFEDVGIISIAIQGVSNED